MTRRLRKGEWSIQRALDLHRQRRGLRCLRVVHGKGLGSPRRVPVLKSKVQAWLVQKQEVLAIVQARADEGGARAVVVLLKPLS